MVTRAELKIQAKEQLKGNIGIIFLCNLIVGFIGFFVGIIPIAGVVGIILIIPVFIFGMVNIYLNLTVQSDAKVKRLFEGFNDFGRVFCVGFFQYILIFFWSLLFIVPGIIKMISYSMSYYIAVENSNLSSLEAIKESEKIMDGNKMDYFVLMLSFFPYILLVILTFGIAAIYVVPYMETTVANFYNSVKEDANIYN